VLHVADWFRKIQFRETYPHPVRLLPPSLSSIPSCSGHSLWIFLSQRLSSRLSLLRQLGNANTPTRAEVGPSVQARSIHRHLPVVTNAQASIYQHRGVFDKASF
jgi:hypothetical protein